MATKIVTKNSSTAASVPTAAQLVKGELAVNVTDKRLFTENNSGTVVELGTNPSTLDVSGEIVATGGIKITETAGGNFLKFDVDGTADEATVGMDATDLIISVDPTNARFSSDFIIKNDGTETFRIASNGVATFAGEITANGGIDVTGGISTSDNITVTKNSSSAPATLTLNCTDPTIVTNQVLSVIDFKHSDSTDAGVASKIQSVSDFNTGVARLEFFTGSPSSLTKAMQIKNNGDISFYEDTGTTPKLFWDASAESLGIGTAPTQRLHVNSDGIQIAALFETASSVSARIGLSDANTTGANKVGIGATGDTLGLYAGGGSASVTVDASGNVGIGTSSPSETLAVESASNNAILLNSPANRYNAVGFQSAGVDKWWMGRADTDIIAGDAFFIGADAGNATDAGGTSAKLVIDSSGRVIIPAGVTLGTATGVYNAANTLDDYEEGTWTPTIVGSTSGTATLTVSSSSYTKIGNTVRVDCFITAADVTGISGAVRLAGLPFGAFGYTPITLTYCNLFSFNEADGVGGFVESGNTYVNLVYGSSKLLIQSTSADATNGTAMFTLVYKTNA